MGKISETIMRVGETIASSSTGQQAPRLTIHQKNFTGPHFSGGLTLARLFEPETIQKNEMASRCIIDSAGYSLWSVIIARNMYERIENAGDWVAWLIAAIAGPLLIAGPAAKWLAERKVLNKAPQAFTIKQVMSNETCSPLRMPFELLNQAGFGKRLEALIQKEVARDPETLKKLAEYGLKSFKHLTPELANRVLWSKIGIVWIDLFVLALKGQGFQWAKNWITEKLSGRKGFSGELKYASKEYLEKQTAGYQREKRKRMLTSMGMGFGAACLFPLVLAALVKSKSANGILNVLKNKALHRFNYSDVIFMSKFVLVVHNLFNWVGPSLLASRDRHELREKAIKLGTFDALFFIGDDVFGSILGKLFERWQKGKLEIPLTRKNDMGFPTLLDLADVKKALLAVKGLVPEHLVQAAESGEESAVKALNQFLEKTASYRWARYGFWGGLGLTALVMGITMPLLNMWYTKKKVLAEQANLKLEQANLKLQQVRWPFQQQAIHLSNSAMHQQLAPLFQAFNPPEAPLFKA